MRGLLRAAEVSYGAAVFDEDHPSEVIGHRAVVRMSEAVDLVIEVPSPYAPELIALDPRFGRSLVLEATTDLFEVEMDARGRATGAFLPPADSQRNPIAIQVRQDGDETPPVQVVLDDEGSFILDDEGRILVEVEGQTLFITRLHEEH